MIHVPSTEEACAAQMPAIDKNTAANRGVIRRFPIPVVIKISWQPMRASAAQKVIRHRGGCTTRA
jgi:hypothetical protein